MKKIDPILQDRLNKLITSMGYEFVGCEAIPQGSELLFRIYIDAPKGVTIDDCSLVSRQISALMDVEDPIQARYRLEVSSPGLDRPLFELEHFKRFIGQRVKVKLYTPVDQRRQFKGIIQSVEGETITLILDDTGAEVRIAYALIDKANIIADVTF